MKKRSLQIAKTFEDIVNFRSRTLKTKIVDDKILSEDVIFYAYSKCQICDKNINLIIESFKFLSISFDLSKSINFEVNVTIFSSFSFDSFCSD